MCIQCPKYLMSDDLEYKSITNQSFVHVENSMRQYF